MRKRKPALAALLRAAAVALLWLPAGAAQSTGSIHGSVADARGGEALANAQIQLAGTPFKTVSDKAGKFSIAGIPAGDYTLGASTVGYHLARKAFHLAADEDKEFVVALTPDTLRQTDSVEVKGDPFEPARTDSPDALTLAGNDAKNLGSVLADDPLRAVQNLPGVTSDNDFESRFSLRGADYGRIGLYLDGVLLHEPFHMLEGNGATGSASAFNADMVDEMELHEGAFPARFDDRTAGLLDVTTREGSRSAYVFRMAASASNAGAMAEGPLGRRGGKKPRGSWLIALRKSYLQYILARTFPGNSLIFGLQDLQARLNYDLTSKLTATLSVLESYSNLDRSSSKSTLGVNSTMEAGYHYTLTNAGLRYTPTDKLLIATHGAWMREKYDDTDPQALPLAAGFYGEWVWNASATYLLTQDAPFEAGWSVRRARDAGYGFVYNLAAQPPRALDRWNGTGMLTGGYAQQSWTALGGALRLNAGVRWDRNSVDRATVLLPEASAAVGLSRSTRIQLAWGEYAQYPEVAVFASVLGNRSLLPARSIHEVAAVERRLGARTRLRAEFYNRTDRDLPFQSTFDPRTSNGKIIAPPANPVYANSLRGYSRGAEVFLQRSSANRFTGWVSYAFGHAEMHDGISKQTFASDFDQKHTVNTYGGYRLKPTVNLSLRYSYGSGFPIPGYVIGVGSNYFLFPTRNQQRLPSYQRTDVRVNKAWQHDRWKLTLYGEVVNLTSRTNYVFESFDSYNSKTGQAFLTLDKTFPILPSAGVVAEW